MLDLLIRNGNVVDGTGQPPVRKDIAIQGGLLREIGDLSRAEAARTLDATGKLVCPGFIDAHSHSDAFLLVDPRAVSKITQGITTEICGNCGASAAPRFGAGQMPADWADKSFPGTWSSVAEFRALLARVQPAPNAVLLVGHNALRGGIIGYEARPARPEELQSMCRILEQSLGEGARGLSTGLIYPPGMFAAPEEIHALAKVVARHGGVYTSHMRNEGARLLAAMEEIIGVSRASGVRSQISHLKTSGRANWPLLDSALEKIRQARAAGLEVAADRYPYTSSSTDLDVVFPAWAEEGGRAAILARLRDSATRMRLRTELLASRSPDGWDSITIGSTHHPDNQPFRGQPLTAVARVLKLDPVDALLYLVEKDELRTSAFFAGMSEDNLWRIYAEPYVMVGTDASIRALDGPLSLDYPHPRAYGSFPRFLRAVLDGRTVSLPEAIRKMTALPAEHFGLHDRGLLLPGKAADVVVIDSANLSDRATYAAPHQISRGVESVIVNGCLTWHEGQFTGNRAGKVL